MSNLPRFLADVLGEHLGRIDTDPEALLLTAEKGGPLGLSNFRNRVWRLAVRRAELPVGVTIHDLRHTSASLLIDQGASMEMVRDQLGHSTIAVTQRYTHLYPDSVSQVLQALDQDPKGSVRGRCGVEELGHQPGR